jgi:hypothetical protein
MALSIEHLDIGAPVVSHLDTEFHEIAVHEVTVSDSPLYLNE